MCLQSTFKYNIKVINNKLSFNNGHQFYCHVDLRAVTTDKLNALSLSKVLRLYCTKHRLCLTFALKLRLIKSIFFFIWKYIKCEKPMIKNRIHKHNKKYRYNKWNQWHYNCTTNTSRRNVIRSSLREIKVNSTCKTISVPKQPVIKPM